MGPDKTLSSPATQGVCRNFRLKQKPPAGIPEGVFKWESGVDLLSRAEAHYHWRDAVSRSCSGWEGVVPAGY